jgi:tetratricopeptide (TPR) repeat protein
MSFSVRRLREYFRVLFLRLETGVVLAISWAFAVVWLFGRPWGPVGRIEQVGSFLPAMSVGFTFFAHYGVYMYYVDRERQGMGDYLRFLLRDRVAGSCTFVFLVGVVLWFAGVGGLGRDSRFGYAFGPWLLAVCLLAVVIANYRVLAEAGVLDGNARSVRMGVAEVEIGRAWDLAGKGKTEEAEAVFMAASAESKVAGPLIEYGKFLQRVGRLDEAEVMCRDAVRIAERGGYLERVAAFTGLGDVLAEREDLDGAGVWFQKALQESKLHGKPSQVAYACLKLGALRMERDDDRGAELLYGQALEIADKGMDVELLGTVYSHLGSLYVRRGDEVDAERMFKESLMMLKGVAASDAKASSYTCLGGLMSEGGDKRGAERMYQKAIRVNEKLGDLEEIAWSCDNMGRLLMGKEDPSEAWGWLERALKTWEKLGREEEMAEVAGEIDRLRMRMGRLKT